MISSNCFSLVNKNGEAMKYFYTMAIAVISFALITGCGEEEKEEVQMDPHAGVNMQGMGGGTGDEMFENPESNLKMDGQTLSFENVSMQVPEGWVKEKPASSMRVIQFFSKNDEELIIAGFYFGKFDEMIPQNIERWENEFAKLENSKNEEYAGGKAIYVELEGTYRLKPFPMAQEFEEVEGYKTLAAIIKTDNGPYYFKAVGKKESADAEIANFKSFLKSYKAE